LLVSAILLSFVEIDLKVIESMLILNIKHEMDDACYEIIKTHLVINKDSNFNRDADVCTNSMSDQNPCH